MPTFRHFAARAAAPLAACLPTFAGAAQAQFQHRTIRSGIDGQGNSIGLASRDIQAIGTDMMTAVQDDLKRQRGR